MGIKSEAELVKSFKFLERRSAKSRGKTADSFMNVSTKMISTVFVALLVSPLAMLIAALFIKDPEIVSVSELATRVESYIWLFSFWVVVVLGVAVWIRRWAMDIEL